MHRRHGAAQWRTDLGVPHFAAQRLLPRFELPAERDREELAEWSVNA
jgi:hypothetical protein